MPKFKDETGLWLTTGEVAKRCDVVTKTVVNWIKAGKLKASRAGNGHRRVHVRDFERFRRESNMNRPEWDDGF